MNVRQLINRLQDIEARHGGSVEVFAFDASGREEPVKELRLWQMAAPWYRPAVLIVAASMLCGAKELRE